MTFRTLIRRSLRFHWRSHAGVVIGAAIGSAALVGALVVGDSVKGSLRMKAFERLAGTWIAMETGDRFFQADLTTRMFLANSNRVVAGQTGSSELVAFGWTRYEGASELGTSLTSLPASVSRQDGSARANRVSLFAIDPQLPETLVWGGESRALKGEDEVWLNEGLANHLGARVGDQLLLRVSKPSEVGQDATISMSENSVAIRGTVQRILPPFPGNLSLVDQGRTPMNAFISSQALNQAIDLGERGNAMLLPAAYRLRPMTKWDHLKLDHNHWKLGIEEHPMRTLDWINSSGGLISEVGTVADSDEMVELASSLFRSVWTLADAETELVHLTNQVAGPEMRTSRVFIDEPLEEAALEAAPGAQPILTYIANLIIHDTRAAPYSMVTAAGAPWTPEDLEDDEIVLNQWLAEDLQASPGDRVELVYYDPESGARLTEQTNAFRVHSIVPMELPWADRTLMPDFPGIEKAESTADWDTAFPLEYEVRPKDDEYWQEYRGTPKAFITLAAGQEMWANRFGRTTAIRFPLAEDAVDDNRFSIGHGARAQLEQAILANLDPTELGFRFEPVREQALIGAKGAQDFGGLFIGFSLFLIAAALILMALLFQFGMERRASEVGTMLALGFTQKQVRRLLLGEGAALALLGGLIGVLGGVFYAKAMLLGLTTIWNDAVAGASLRFFATPTSLGLGLAASTVIAVVTIWLALRKQARRPAVELLNADFGLRHQETDIGRPGHKAAMLALGSLVGAVVLVGWALMTGQTANAGVFFGGGALVLIAGLALLNSRLHRRANGSGLFTPSALAFRGLARRRSRSVATAALLASGSFLILSIGVFRLDATRDAKQRTSGTGGFTLIGEATLPIAKDLNTPEGLDFFALTESDVQGMDFVPFRVQEGDEASCLNLNRAQAPRLMGVNPKHLEGRFTFAKAAKGLDRNAGWSLLRSAIDNPHSALDAVPAIGDLNSILWAMGKKIGDTLDYVDDRGNTFKVRIVAAVPNSILQGNLIIDETEFLRRFPDTGGYKYFLMDAPGDGSGQAETLSRAMQDYGFEITMTTSRLNQFNNVQNTYLGTFQVIGGLGLLLGSAGLGIVVLRNVLERRGELAALMALGFRQQKIGRLVLTEHAALLGLGLAIGLAAAAVAVLPTLLSSGSRLPYSTLVPTLVAVLVNGLIWTWIACRVALRGELLEGLRNE